MYCQKCRTPLRLDSSLEDLNPAAYDLLVGTTAQTTGNNVLKSATSSRPQAAQERQRRALYDEASKDAGPPAFKKPAANARAGDMSFIYLTESQLVPPSKTAETQTMTAATQSSKAEKQRTSNSVPEDADNQLERITKLFEILSARSDIDHPVCVECTELLVAEMERKLQQSEKEREAYTSYLKQLQTDEPTVEEIRDAEKELEQAEKAEADALAELKDLERQKAECDAELLKVEEEARQLDLEEDRFWRERNDFALELANAQAERDSIQSRYEHDLRLLEKLRRSNVYNDAFCISYDGSFATINNLRLGRLSSNPVDWPEINAAWGHALLLLVVVADKLEYKFKGFELQPMGSTSTIIRYETISAGTSRYGSSRNANAPPPAPKKHVLELYSSGDMPLGLTFMHRKFDQAMVAFLELVRQLGEFVHQKTAVPGGAAATALTLPYKIEGDKIDNVSIRLGIAPDESWTRACKLTLTCCKYLLACTSNFSNEKAASERESRAKGMT